MQAYILMTSMVLSIASGVCLLLFRNIEIGFVLVLSSFVLGGIYFLKNYVGNSTKSLSGEVVSDSEFYKSQVKHLEAELHSSKEHANQLARLASLGEVAGNMGHEINNQLAVIEGWADQLSGITDDKLNEDFIKRAGSRILENIKRLNLLTKAVRNYVRKSNEQDMVFCSAEEFIEQAISLAAPKIKKKNILLKKFVDGKDFNIQCISVELSQVVLNLISNAVDAIEQQEKPWIQVRLTEEGEFVLISVTDSGEGIPDEIVSKIMEPYFTTKGAGKGTGIGLSISTNIIKSHQGSLEYDNSFKNTRFVIRLPKKQSTLMHQEAKVG